MRIAEAISGRLNRPETVLRVVKVVMTAILYKIEPGGSPLVERAVTSRR